MHKKSVIYFILLLTSINWTYGHDIHAALFELYTRGETYFIDIRIDRNDLASAITDECGVEFGNMTLSEKNTLIEQYLLDRLSISFDQQSGVYRLYNYTYDQNYITIKGVFDAVEVDKNLTDITIFNSCLIDSVEKHNNMIHVNLKGRTRSFRLSKDRLSTNIKY